MQKKNKIQAIRKQLSRINKQQLFDPCQIAQIAEYKKLSEIDSFLKQAQISDSSFVSSLKDILQIGLNKSNNTTQYQLEEKEFEHQRAVCQIRQYQELMRRVDETGKHEGLFSYKQIKILELLIFATKCSEEAKSKGSKNHPSSLSKQVKNLKLSLEHQGWLENFTIKKEVQNMACGQISTIENSIAKIKKQIMVIDIDRLAYLVNESYQSANRIFNCEGIVFVGLTGSGKSSTILSFMGHEMVESSAGMRPKKLLSIPGGDKIIASSSSKSVTKSVNAVVIPDLMLESTIKSKDTYLVDTPGFDDTEGAVADLSNACGTSHAIKNLASARFVLVFSGKDEGSRLQGLKHIIEIMCQLFPNFKETAKSVTYLFNRYSQQDIVSINAKLINLKNQHKIDYSNSKSQNILDIYKDLIQKTKSVEEIIMFNPINKDISYSKQHLRTILNTPSTSQVENVFEVTLTKTVKFDIEKQVRTLEQMCLHYYQKNNIDVSRYYLAEIVKFRKVFSKHKCPEAMSNSIHKIQKKIAEKLTTQCNITQNSFNKALLSNTLTQEMVNDYFQQIDSIDKCIISNEFNVTPDFEKKLLQNINRQTDRAMSDLQSNLDETREESIRLTIVILTKLNRLGDIQKIKEMFDKSLEQFLRCYQLSLDQGNIDEALKYYKKYKGICRLQCCLELKSSEKQKNIDFIVIQRLEQKKVLVLNLIEKLIACQQSELDQISKMMNFIFKIKQSRDYLLLISNSADVQRKLSQFIDEAKTRAISSFKIANGAFDSKGFKKKQIKNVVKINWAKNMIYNISYLKQAAHEWIPTIQNNIKKSLNEQVVDIIDQIKKQYLNLTKDRLLRNKMKEINAQITSIQDVITHYYYQDIDTERIQSSLSDFYYNVLAQINQAQRLRLCFDDQNTDMIIERLYIASAAIESYCAVLKKDGDLKQGFLDRVLDSIKVSEDKQISRTFNNHQLHESIRAIYKAFISIINQYYSKTQSVISSIKTQNKEIHQDKVTQNKFSLSQTNACLKFIHKVGPKLICFQTICEKIINYQSQLTSRIQTWMKESVYCIELLINRFKDFDIKEIKSEVKVLKSKIQFVDELENSQYVFIKEILKEYSEFMKQSLQEKIEQLHKEHYNYYDKNQKDPNKLYELVYKCSILSRLDDFIRSDSKFEKLTKTINSTLNKLKLKKQNYLKNLLKNKHYEQALQQLSVIKEEYQIQIFEDFVNEFENYLKQDLEACDSKNIKMRKVNQSFASIVNSTIEPFKKLLEVQKQLSRSNLKQEQKFSGISMRIQANKKSYKEFIRQGFRTRQQQIQSAISCHHLELAYTMYKEYEPVYSVINEQQQLVIIQFQKYKGKLSDCVNQFHQKYAKHVMVNLPTFKDDYIALFHEQKITFTELSNLKKAIEKRVNEIINDHIRDLQDNRDAITHSHLKKLNIFIDQLPFELKNNRNCKSLFDLIENIEHKIKKQRKFKVVESKKIGQLFLKSQEINPEVIDCLMDEGEDELVKEELIKGVQKTLSEALKQSASQSIFQLLDFVEHSRLLLQPNYKKINKHISKLISVYKSTYLDIQNSVLSLVSGKLQQFLFTTILKTQQTQLVIDIGDIKEMVKMFKKLIIFGQNRCFPNTSNQVIQKLKQFSDDVIKAHKTALSSILDCEVIKESLDRPSKILESLQPLHHLCNIEKFIAAVCEGLSEFRGNETTKYMWQQFKLEYLVFGCYYQVITSSVIPFCKKQLQKLAKIADSQSLIKQIDRLLPYQAEQKTMLNYLRQALSLLLSNQKLLPEIEVMRMSRRVRMSVCDVQIPEKDMSFGYMTERKLITEQDEMMSMRKTVNGCQTPKSRPASRSKITIVKEEKHSKRPEESNFKKDKKK